MQMIFFFSVFVAIVLVNNLRVCLSARYDPLIQIYDTIVEGKPEHAYMYLNYVGSSYKNEFFSSGGSPMKLVTLTDIFTTMLVTRT